MVYTKEREEAFVDYIRYIRLIQTCKSGVKYTPLKVKGPNRLVRDYIDQIQLLSPYKTEIYFDT